MHLRLAVPRNGSDGADFVDIVTFDKLASSCAEWLTKDREVAVVGRLRLLEWTGRDGERRSKIQVVADAVQFLGAPTKAAGPGGGVAEPADKRGRRRLPPQGRLTARWGGHSGDGVAAPSHHRSFERSSP